MTHVSRKRLSEKSSQVLNEALNHVFSNLKPNEVKKVLNTLLTKTEKQMLSKRIGIIHLLQNKINESKIAEATKTTNQTVSRIRLQLLEIPQESKKTLTKKLNSWKNINLLKSIINEVSKGIFSGSKLVYKRKRK